MDAFIRAESRVAVRIEASDFSCDGFVHLPGIRLSDLMNEPGRFLVVVDAVVRKHGGAGGAKRTVLRFDTIFVRKDEIKYVIPMEAADKSPRTNLQANR